MNAYKVWLRSKPGMWERYDGYVSVRAHNDEHAIGLAFTKIQRDFPDRGRGAWELEKVERSAHG